MSQICDISCNGSRRNRGFFKKCQKLKGEVSNGKDSFKRCNKETVPRASFCRAADRRCDRISGIQNIQNDKINYYLNNSKLIFEYFENKKLICKNSNKKTILNNFFKSKKQIDNENIQDIKHINNNKKYLINVDESFIDINDYIVQPNICDCGGEFVLIDHDGVLVCKKCSVIYDTDGCCFCWNKILIHI
jgi:hypothetical protein